MKKKKYIGIAIVICFVVYTLMIQEDLRGYKTGFFLKGTYKTVGEAPGNAEYLAFSQIKESGKNIFFYYKQLDFEYKGNYISTDNANLYRLDIDNLHIDNSYILVEKDKIYIIKDKNVLECEKIADEVLIMNPPSKTTGK